MFWFSFASLTPAVLLAVASLAGGAWAYVALAGITLAVAALDGLTRVRVSELEEARAETSGTRLSVALGLAHFVLLPLGVVAVARASTLSAAEAVALAVGLALFMGQISHPNAHELIHRPGRGLRRLGTMTYISMLFGHHASAHPKVHHVHVGTARDPNTPRPGEGFHRFWLRAWTGSFRAGWAAETRDRSRRAVPGPVWRHPYIGYCAGALVTVALAGLLAGGAGIVVLLVLAGYAQMQVLLADYVQHYGLWRRVGDDGRPVPVGPQHSWNAPHWYSAAMMLNAPRHSDHHMHPGRAFPALRLDPGRMPILPRSMPVMCTIALVPPLWRKIMDPRAGHWRQGEWSGAPRSDKLVS